MRFNYRIENHTKLNPINRSSSANLNCCCKQYVLMWNIPSDSILWIRCSYSLQCFCRKTKWRHCFGIVPEHTAHQYQFGCAFDRTKMWNRWEFSAKMLNIGLVFHSTRKSRLGWRVFSKPAGIRCVQCVPRLHIHFSLAFKTHFERVQYSFSSFSHFPRVQVEKKIETTTRMSMHYFLHLLRRCGVCACDLRAVLSSCILYATTRFIVNTWWNSSVRRNSAQNQHYRLWEKSIQLH